MSEKVDVRAKEKKRNKLVQVFIDLKAEFKRVTWPSKEELKSATLAVLSFCILYVILVGLLDAGFKNLFSMIFK